MAKGRLIFVTGTDTGIGKSYATGLLARAYLALGKRVITQKPVQTGARGPEDILIHRRLMGLPPDPPELLRLTCPYIFEYPAAPETAASLEGRKIDHRHLLQCLRELSENYEVVLVEGAGGLYVPLTEDLTILDFISLIMCPVLVVSAARLGTINHTVLTLKALKARGLYVAGLIYNLYFVTDELLAERSLRDIKRLAEIDRIVRLPKVSEENPPVESFLSFVENTPGLRP